MKTKIPTYIKNVLWCCGYDSYFTISSMDESDIEYFETEVRKGNFNKKFESLFEHDENPSNMLEGSVKSLDDFEITRGHRKLILAVSKFVEETLKQKGIDAFFEPSKPNKKKHSSTNRIAAPMKKQKIYEPGQEPGDENDLEHHRKTLIEKAMAVAINVTPDLYKNVSSNM